MLETHFSTLYETNYVSKKLYKVLPFRYGLFFIKSRKVIVYIVSNAANPRNELPNMANLFNRLRRERIASGTDDSLLPTENHEFVEIKVERDIKKVHRMLDKGLTSFIAERHGPTVLALHSRIGHSQWIEQIPALGQLPVISTHTEDDPRAYPNIGWQPIAASIMIGRYLDLASVLEDSLEKSRYFEVPWGNLPKVTVAAVKFEIV